MYGIFIVADIASEVNMNNKISVLHCNAMTL
jgi:hypothetical protein